MGITKSAFWACSALPGTSLTTDTIELACILFACRERHDVMNSRLHPCKQRDGSARLSAKCKRRHLRTHSKMKELGTLAAGLPTIFQDREGGAAGGVGSYRPCRRHTSLEVRQRLMSWDDDAT